MINEQNNVSFWILKATVFPFEPIREKKSVTREKWNQFKDSRYLDHPKDI